VAAAEERLAAAVAAQGAEAARRMDKLQAAVDGQVWASACACVRARVCLRVRV
jgi:hypothetical protein